MSDINPNNYPGANVTVVGTAAGPWKTREFPNGGSVAELSVAVNNGYKEKNTNEWVDTSTNWYTASATPEYASENWPEVGPGDRVRLDDGRLEARAFTSQGEAKAALDIRFAKVTVVSRKGETTGGGKSGGDTWSAPASSAQTPF